MRHRFLWTILLLLTLFVMAGCAQGSERNLPESSNQSGVTALADQLQNIPGLPDVLLNEGWPADLVPAELPEYTEGNVANFGESDGLYIKIKDTDPEKLGRYLAALKKAGWIITGDSNGAEAMYGLYTVHFDWQGGRTMLQMVVYTEEAGSWPFGEIPSDILPPQTGTLVGGVGILQSAENMWYFNYTYDGIDEEAAREYMKMLIKNGWSGDEMMVYKRFEWKGKRYEASVELYETVENRTTFTCNFYYGD